MPASTAPGPLADERSFSPGQRLRFVTGHALLPLGVLALIAGTLLWGSFVTLGLAAIGWRLVTSFA